MAEARRPAPPVWVAWLAAGAALFVLNSTLGAAGDGDEAGAQTDRAPVVVPVPEDASPAQVQALLDEAVLAEAALAAGVAARDGVIADRLRRDVAFAGGGARDGETPWPLDDRELVGDLVGALVRRDPVVRRRLAWHGRELLARTGEAALTREGLAAYVAAHPQRFATPARVWAHHVFLARTDDPAVARTRATQLLGELQALWTAPESERPSFEAAAGFGDPFLGGHALSGVTPALLERRLGPGVGRALLEAPVGIWVGPVRSAYGEHLVHVTRLEAATAGDLSDGATAARATLEAEHDRRDEAVAQRLDALRARFPVTVQRFPVELAPVEPTNDGTP